jgi:hypothetical protein
MSISAPPTVLLGIVLPSLAERDARVVLGAAFDLAAGRSRLGWHYDADRALLLLLRGGIEVPAQRITAAELAALRYVQEIAAHPTPLLVATLLDNLATRHPTRLLVATLLDNLATRVPLLDPCGCCTVDAERVAANLRRRAVLH